jgi:hypothetical protein
MMSLRPCNGHAAVQRPHGARTALGFLLFALALRPDGTVAQTPTPITLPDKPNSASVASTFPSCAFTPSLAVLTKCAVDLELYRASLEDYNGSLGDYIADLKRSDAKLESLRVKGRVSAADYDDLHDQIATELRFSSLTDGKYLKVYKTYMARYKGQSREVEKAQERCRVSLSCKNASA